MASLTEQPAYGISKGSRIPRPPIGDIGILGPAQQS
ncbi:hypothetical protein SHM7688_03824 [Shimia marina]|uniref:Uncharacterized protein n=1 Tax=Shimia marina TaxID=321267 RepID=A0A0P1EV68_9RHOB|nr:hypothetical protein SHM7688_03824 [Shimia marina]